MHCRLVVSQAGELEVEDLDSTDGTFVNDQRVQRAMLNAGDRLRIGRVELAVTRESPAARDLRDDARSYPEGPYPSPCPLPDIGERTVF